MNSIKIILFLFISSSCNPEIQNAEPIESYKSIQKIEDSLAEEFDYSKIEPLDTKVKIPESIKKNGGKYKYVDENGDSIIVNVIVAKYDE